MLEACLIALPLIAPVGEDSVRGREVTPWARAPESFAAIPVSGSVPLDPDGQWTAAVRSAGLQGLLLHLADRAAWPDGAWLGEWEKLCASKGLALGLSFGERPSKVDLAGLLRSCQALFCVSLPVPDPGGDDGLRALVGRLTPGALGRGMAPAGGPANERVFTLDTIRAWPLAQGAREEEAWLAAYDQSVGRGAFLRLDLELDGAGRIRPDDAALLERIGIAMHQTYGTNRAAGGTACASSEDADGNHPAASCLDGNVASFWTPAPGTRRAFLELTLPRERIIDRVLLRAPLGVQAAGLAFDIHLRTHGVWREVARGTGIGRCRILAVDPAPATALRVVLDGGDERPALSVCELYASPPRVTIDATETVFLGSARVRLESTYPGAQVRYTLDGQEVTSESTLYRAPFSLEQTCTLTAVAFATDGSTPIPARQHFRRYTLATLRGPEEVHDLAPGLLRLDSDPQWASWVGFVSVPRDGIYAFFEFAPGPTRLFIGDEALLGEGKHMGEVGLKAGWHALCVECSPYLAPAQLQLAWRGPGLPKGALPIENLGHRRPKD